MKEVKKNYYIITGEGIHTDTYIGDNGSLTGSYGNARRVTKEEAKRAFHSSKYYLGDAALFRLDDNLENPEYVGRTRKLIENSAVPRHYVIVSDGDLRREAIVSANSKEEAVNRVYHQVINSHGWYESTDTLVFKPTRIAYSREIDKQEVYDSLNK